MTQASGVRMTKDTSLLLRTLARVLGLKQGELLRDLAERRRDELEQHPVYGPLLPLVEQAVTREEQEKETTGRRPRGMMIQLPPHMSKALRIHAFKTKGDPSLANEVARELIQGLIQSAPADDTNNSPGTSTGGADEK